MMNIRKDSRGNNRRGVSFCAEKIVCQDGKRFGIIAKLCWYTCSNAFDGQLLAQNEIIKEEIEFAKENNSADEVKVRDVPWATKYEDGDEARLRLSFSKYVCRILVARQYP